MFYNPFNILKDKINIVGSDLCDSGSYGSVCRAICLGQKPKLDLL